MSSKKKNKIKCEFHNQFSCNTGKSELEDLTGRDPYTAVRVPVYTSHMFGCYTLQLSGCEGMLEQHKPGVLRGVYGREMQSRGHYILCLLYIL